MNFGCMNIGALRNFKQDQTKPRSTPRQLLFIKISDTREIYEDQNTKIQILNRTTYKYSIRPTVNLICILYFLVFVL